ncbi:MAG: glycosyltransferase family 39 protein [Candidatus Omnitrophota bacterium]|nr:glycosyltransferase family 39 protein [Candidatus Omnitrophota bacterium]
MTLKESKVKMSITDKYLWVITIIILCFIFVYQLFKNFSPYIVTKDIILQGKNYFMLVTFCATGIFSVIFIKNIEKYGKAKSLFLLLSIFLVLSISYVNFGKRSWKGSDVAYDLYGQSIAVNEVGILNYMANYNSYGVLPDESKDNFSKHLNLLGVNEQVERISTEKADIYGKQYHHFSMNPPLSSLICFFWMKIFGFSKGSLNLFILVITFVNLIILYQLFCLLFQKAIATWLSLVWITTPETLKILNPPTLEPFVIFFLLFAVYMFYLSEKKKRSGFHFVAGVFAGLAIYTKFTAIPIFLMFVILYTINFIPRRFKPLRLFVLGSLSIISVFLFLGYNPVYTIITAGLKTQYYIRNNPLSFVRYISLPLYLGFPMLALVFLAIKEAIKPARNKIKIFENNENFLYFVTFILMYIIYFSTDAPNRYCMPYFPLLLIILGRYIQEKENCLSRYNYIFFFNLPFIVLSEFL